MFWVLSKTALFCFGFLSFFHWKPVRGTNLEHYESLMDREQLQILNSFWTMKWRDAWMWFKRFRTQFRHYSVFECYSARFHSLQHSHWSQIEQLIRIEWCFHVSQRWFRRSRHKWISVADNVPKIGFLDTVTSRHWATVLPKYDSAMRNVKRHWESDRVISIICSCSRQRSRERECHMPWDSPNCALSPVELLLSQIILCTSIHLCEECVALFERNKTLSPNLRNKSELHYCDVTHRCFKSAISSFRSVIPFAGLLRLSDEVRRVPRKRFSFLSPRSWHDFDVSEFHSRCDGHGNILTVILDIKWNNFRGFMRVKWELEVWNNSSYSWNC
jgi:hypothetical protein